MKKSLILLISILSLLLLNLFTISFTTAQEALPPIPGLSGEIDEDTGLPSEFTKFKELGNQLSEEEKRKEYLKQEWTKILAEKKVIGPVLFYTNKFFNFFNPLWKYTFGLEFSFSWAFFFSIIIWITLIVLIYSPAKAFINANPFFPLIASIIIASLAGSTGIISKTIDLLTTILKNLWLVGLSIIITGVILFIYYKFFGNLEEDLKKESKEEEVKRAEETIITSGKVAKENLKNN